MFQKGHVDSQDAIGARLQRNRMARAETLKMGGTLQAVNARIMAENKQSIMAGNEESLFMQVKRAACLRHDRSDAALFAPLPRWRPVNPAGLTTASAA